MRLLVLFFFMIIIPRNDCFSQSYISPLDSLFTNNINILTEKCISGKLYNPSIDKNEQLKDFLLFMNSISDKLFTVFPDGKQYQYTCFTSYYINAEQVQLLNQWYQSHKYAINACMSIEDYEDDGKYLYPNYPLTFEELKKYDFDDSKVDIIRKCIMENGQNHVSQEPGN